MTPEQPRKVVDTFSTAVLELILSGADKDELTMDEIVLGVTSALTAYGWSQGIELKSIALAIINLLEHVDVSTKRTARQDQIMQALTKGLTTKPTNDN